jgi:hypothetical protein
MQFAFGTQGVGAVEAARPARHAFAWRRVQ